MPKLEEIEKGVKDEKQLLKFSDVGVILTDF